MQTNLNQWDYLVVTASNDAQARAYDWQLKIRQDLGFLSDIRNVMVVPDVGGKRIGSGGSTVYCLLEVLNHQLDHGMKITGKNDCLKVLKNLRILIIHAGGDSRRLPAYGPCGKIFVPIPGESDSALPLSLFDRQLPVYLALPQPSEGTGQVVITSGDVLLRFEPEQVRLKAEGLTGLSCYVTPQQAGRHGVFCKGDKDRVRLYLQKPSPAEQQQQGAVNPYGQSCVDIGVISFDAATAFKMLEVFGVRENVKGCLTLDGEMTEAVRKWGLDFYREICCAMGDEATKSTHRKSAQNSGSKWSNSLLEKLFDAFSAVPFNMQLLKHCEFLDFGANRGLINSGTRVLQQERGVCYSHSHLDINNDISESAEIKASASWIEGCKISSKLTLGGENLIVGVDIDEPVELGKHACLDVIQGKDRNGENVWFVRCYCMDDTFKKSTDENIIFCGVSILDWLKTVEARPRDIWDDDIKIKERSIWNARLFPAVKNHKEYQNWLWMFDTSGGCKKDFKAYLEADRYSLSEILSLADRNNFYKRRNLIRAKAIQNSLPQMFSPNSRFSASELAYLLKADDDAGCWIAKILSETCRNFVNNGQCDLDSLVLPRILHTLGSALLNVHKDKDILFSRAMPSLRQTLGPVEKKWLKSSGLDIDCNTKLHHFAGKARNAAFECLQKVIVSSGTDQNDIPKNFLRTDEIVWARVPARLDVGGGWTDTPPYSLEYGGCVVNAAVNLNGQPPIQVYARVTKEPVITISSIDLGVKLRITTLDELLDYRKATSNFALAKAAIALSGFSPETADWDKGTTLKKMLSNFGGGIELTTLAAIPKGSGLGTSSIMGAVLIAAIQQMTGRTLTQRQLFHSVLRLEQALTTGGGWQDQVGGVVDSVKMITTKPALVPDAKIHYLPPDVLDPKANKGQSLLYYTGITRLAKNILQQIVGRYLNRDRATMETLRQIGLVAAEVADAFVCKDIERFGNLVDVAWRLNKQLDPNSSNDEIEALLERVRPFIYGAKLLGAGGGGFLLMICKSTADSLTVREMLESHPPNERARFFDFDISREGLTVSVC